MNCPACQHENRAGRRFCAECGGPLALTCSACGSQNEAGEKFCGDCGASLAPVKDEGATAERDPRAYTPKHLADKILQSKSALEGERKHVTVLFADLRGSTELTEQLDPEAWHTILNRFFQILTDGVHRFEGTVNQYTGDGIMALFGAPIAHEDHAQRACHAALRMRDGLCAFATEVRREHGLDLATRMGLNSGEVVVGRIGDDLRMDYTARGHAVHLAQRMEQLAESGGVYLTEHTARLIEGFFTLTDQGPFTVKGVSRPVGVFRLEGAGVHTTRFEQSVSRGFSTFVGREDEMRILRANMERTRAGTGQVIGVVAHPGIGKSRLCWELLEEQRREHGQRHFVLRGIPHGQHIPLYPMIDALRSFAELRDDDTPTAVRAKITTMFRKDGIDPTEGLPVLCELLGLPDPDRPTGPMDPRARQQRIFEIYHRVTIARAEHEAGVFLAEDLHWWDAPSLEYLSQVIDLAPSTRTMVVATFRPEFRAPWMERPSYQQVALTPLEDGAAARMLADLLGSDPSLDGVPALIAERTGGNPLFVEEAVQALAEQGSLDGVRGAYRLAEPIETLDVPPTVQALLAARIDRLGTTQKSVVQTAAVLGRRFGERLLAAVADESSADVASALADLARAELLYETAFHPEREYKFKHALTQEVAYDSQLGDRRRRVHRAVAETAETLYAGELDERAALIAHHWKHAGDLGKAARWYARAAQWVAATNLEAAGDHWRHVRALVAHLEDRESFADLIVAAGVQLLSLSWRIGFDEEESTRVFEESRTVLAQSGDTRALSMLLGAYAVNRVAQTGSAIDYVRYCHEAIRMAEESGDRAVLTAECAYASFAEFFSGRGPAALQWADRVWELAGPDNDLGRDVLGFSPRAGTLHTRSLALAMTGCLEEARRQLDVARRVAREAGDLEVEQMLVAAWSFHAETRGAADPGGLAIAARSIEIGERYGSESSRHFGYEAMGIAHMLAGRLDEARESLEESLSINRKRRIVAVHELLTLIRLSEVYRQLGDRERTFDTSRQAIDRANRGGCLYHEAQAQLAEARALLTFEDGPPRAAIEAALGRAAHLVEDTGARGLAPQILEQRGHLAHALGDQTGGDRLLGESLALYREIGATGHAERLAKELR